MYLVDKNTWC